MACSHLEDDERDLPALLDSLDKPEDNRVAYDQPDTTPSLLTAALKARLLSSPIVRMKSPPAYRCPGRPVFSLQQLGQLSLRQYPNNYVFDLSLQCWTDLVLPLPHVRLVLLSGLSLLSIAIPLCTADLHTPLQLIEHLKLCSKHLTDASAQKKVLRAIDKLPKPEAAWREVAEKEAREAVTSPGRRTPRKWEPALSRWQKPPGGRGSKLPEMKPRRR